MTGVTPCWSTNHHTNLQAETSPYGLLSLNSSVCCDSTAFCGVPAQPSAYYPQRKFAFPYPSRTTLVFRGCDRLRSTSPLFRPTNLSCIDSLERLHGTTMVKARRSSCGAHPFREQHDPFFLQLPRTSGAPHTQTHPLLVTSKRLLLNSTLTNIPKLSLRPVQVSFGPLAHRTIGTTSAVGWRTETTTDGGGLLGCPPWS